MYACCADRYNLIMRRRIQTVLDQRPILIGAHRQPPVDEITGVVVDHKHERNTRSKDGGRERKRYGAPQTSFETDDYFDGDVSLLGFDDSSGEKNRAEKTTPPVAEKEMLFDCIPKISTTTPIEQTDVPEVEARLPMYHSRVMSEFPPAEGICIVDKYLEMPPASAVDELVVDKPERAPATSSIVAVDNLKPIHVDDEILADNKDDFTHATASAIFTDIPQPNQIVEEMIVDIPKPTQSTEDMVIDKDVTTHASSPAVVAPKSSTTLSSAVVDALRASLASSSAAAVESAGITSDAINVDELMMKSVSASSRVEIPLMLLTLPKSMTDLLEVKESGVEGAGSGCFTRYNIPVHALIGFYFGVPMTEDEFDSLKDKVGLASSYSVWSD
jgi:hypothetical protein